MKLEYSTRREVKAGAIDVEDGAFNSNMYGASLAGPVFKNSSGGLG